MCCRASAHKPVETIFLPVHAAITSILGLIGLHPSEAGLKEAVEVAAEHPPSQDSQAMGSDQHFIASMLPSTGELLVYSLVTPVLVQPLVLHLQNNVCSLLASAWYQSLLGAACHSQSQMQLVSDIHTLRLSATDLRTHWNHELQCSQRHHDAILCTGNNTNEHT